MARKKIREHKAKSLVAKHLKRLSNYDFKHVGISVTPKTELSKLTVEFPWLTNSKLVIKPDMIFGQRGKSGLVLLNVDWQKAEEYLKAHMGKEIEINGLKGKLTHFLVEPFVPHKEEFYLSVSSLREYNVLRFSTQGGINIEENWEKVRSINIDPDQNIEELDLEPLIFEAPAKHKQNLTHFIRGIYKVFDDLSFTFLEMNPFCYLEDGSFFPLDMRGELDDTAFFLCRKKWDDVEFPVPFGREDSKEENFIASLDEKTGASLKLTILNPKGHIWLMVAGGGASVIYTDTVVDLGYGQDLGNYGEYSGNPTEEETFEYAKTILELMTRYNDGKRKALLIGGGIANFTDVAETFKGIISAIEEYKEALEENHVKIFVRRGGPNYKVGLNLMENLGSRLRIPIEVFGPETGMTNIVPLAMNYVRSSSLESKL